MFKYNKIKDFKDLIQKIKEGNFLPSFKCKTDEPIDYKPYRAHVSRLIMYVLTDRILVRNALLGFPPDIKDPSIQTAWHALCHRESDTELRLKDPLYAQEQDDYLEMIAFTLQNSDELPKNIINSYKKYHSAALIPHKKGLKGAWQQILTFLNIV